MKNLQITVGILSLTLAFMLTSCTNSEKRNNPSDQNIKDETRLGGLGNIDDAKIVETDAILTTYLYMKDALVNEDSKIAAEAGKDMVTQFNDFETDRYGENNQQELKEIIEDATEHAQHISENPIDHQREHFDILSKDIIDLIAITGTGKKLYQAYCPMYNNNKGAQWLSESKDIQNPYFGSKMMTCGEVQKVIN
ncbi:MAG: DUF3347 domain-containing protein [Parabacteroides sp.]|nr:DUF3347 domain-containing protein [Parabacteroides sp.]